MFDNVLWGSIVLLVCLSVLDCLTFSKRKNFFPAFVTTFIVLLAFLVFLTTPAPSSLLFFAGLVGLMLYELSVFDNVAYVKLFIAVGLLLMSVKLFFVFAITVLVTILIDKVARYKVFNFKDLNVPVVPHLLFGFLIVTFVGRLF